MLGVRVFVLLLLAFCSVAFAMSQLASQLPSLDSLSDTYFIVDQKAAFSSIPCFAIGSLTRSDDELDARQQIIKELTQRGYIYQDRIIPGSNQLIVLFSLTNEVRSINIYTDEKGHKQTAMIYKDFYQEVGPFSSTLADPSFKGLTRKQTVVKPVQAITIWVYYFSNVNALKEVWESGATSLQGGKVGIDDLAGKALAKFPAQAKKKKG